MDLKARLEAFTEARGTLELYDALCAPESEQVAAVAAALAQFPHHPLAAEARAWLGERGQDVPPEDPAAVLRAHGIDDFGRWYARERTERQRLERALSDALTGQSEARRSAHAYALVCVMLAGAAVMGWMAAFGVWRFVPEPPLPGPHDPPAAEPAASDATAP